MADDSACLWLDAISVTLDNLFGHLPRLTYQVHLPRHHYVELATGENFTDINGSVTILRDVGDSTEREEGVGSMRYVAPFRDSIEGPLPGAYGVEARVAPFTFDELLAAARIGRLPSFFVDVEGLKFSGLPDGSGTKWDNKALPCLKITSIRFTLPLITATDPDASSPPSRSQVAQLSQRIDQFGTAITRRLLWLLWALLAICALILFRR
jgi:hypothetical protein